MYFIHVIYILVNERTTSGSLNFKDNRIIAFKILRKLFIIIVLYIIYLEKIFRQTMELIHIVEITYMKRNDNASINI